MQKHTGWVHEQGMKKEEGKYQIRIGQDQNSADGLDKLLDLWIGGETRKGVPLSFGQGESCPENDVLEIAEAAAAARAAAAGWARFQDSGYTIKRRCTKARCSIT
ncbi:hypothetical protein M0802_002089 [Mischocyttarus mexicanus]|nr:hypothetical protein M0802_002089 [Mischocyttarus mexicanus]